MATTVLANSVAATGNDYLDSLIIGDQWDNDNAITFYFDNGVLPEDVWLDAAKDALRSVFSIYENYIDLDFQEVDNAADANFVLRMNSLDEIDATARFEFPDASDDQAVGQFPFDWSRWTEWHLQQGGYAYETVMHEVGHALGLVHPHGSQGLNEEPFPGVTAANETGDNGLNSAIYTVMSYNDWGQFWAPDNPVSSDYGWGYIGTPMAFDIAALQHIYGANPTYRSGNSTYTLPTVEDDGTFCDLGHRRRRPHPSHRKRGGDDRSACRAADRDKRRRLWCLASGELSEERPELGGNRRKGPGLRWLCAETLCRELDAS